MIPEIEKILSQFEADAKEAIARNVIWYPREIAVYEDDNGVKFAAPGPKSDGEYIEDALLHISKLTAALKMAVEELKYQMTSQSRSGPTASLELVLHEIESILKEKE